jgi:hypothetical protein
MKTITLLLAAIFLSALAHWAQGQPVITTQPQSQTNVVGTDALFSVQATGTEPLGYQWRFYSSDLVNETNTTLVLTNVQVANAGPYTVVVSNVDGMVTSAVATLTVLVPPRFTTQPANQSVSLGATAVFSFVASGTPPLYYQLRFGQTDLVGFETNSGVLRSSLSVTNAQMTDAGDYFVVITNLGGAATSQVAHLEVDATFTKITSGPIVSAGAGYGCAWGDYDNDGFIDLIVAVPYSLANNTPNRNYLFHNNRDGTFTKVTNTVITSEARDWRGCAWADYDNDGNLDLMVVSTVAYGFAAQNEVFRNNGDGTFAKMTPAQVGPIASLSPGGSEACAWADYDRDGFLDMYVARFGLDLLYHNNGDGTYAQMNNVALGLGVTYKESYGAAWADYENNGWPDLFVTVKSDSGISDANLLYLNQGDGTFHRAATAPIATDNEYTVACAWGDYDNDGYLDLFAVNGRYSVATNSLYHNNGDGTFTKATSAMVGSIAVDPCAGSEAAWGDYDNDGFLDLIVAGGTGTTPGTNILYHNNGDGTFTRILSGSPVNDGGSFGCAWGDYDNDGFLDLFMSGLRGNMLLYRNNGNTNGWLKIKLVGTASNRSAIGAKVRVQATIRGRSMWQMREISSGNGACAGPLEAHFGLGDATNIDQVRIEWPSGIVQVLTNVAPRQFLTVVEHQQSLPPPPAPALEAVSISTTGAVNLSATGDVGLLYIFEASTNLVNWTKIGVRSNATGVVSFTDPKGQAYAKRFYRVSIP